LGLLLAGAATVQAGCESDGDCKGDRRCVDDACVDPGVCAKDTDCPGEQVCVERACVAPTAPEPLPAAPQRFSWERVDSTNSSQVSKELSDGFTSESFHITYEVRQRRPGEEHEFKFPSLGFYWRMDQGAELKFRGQESITTRLGLLWRVGPNAYANRIEAMYDGRMVLLIINGQEFGPLEMRKEGSHNTLTRWNIYLRGVDAGLDQLVVKPFVGSIL
jgi:hypothetical protein